MDAEVGLPGCALTDDEEEIELNLHQEPGWTGLFTRNQAEGCYANGTRIIKVAQDKDDAHDVGATGTVLGSINQVL